MLALAFPAMDPVAIAIGPLMIRWYALAYVVGLVLGWRYIRWLAKGRIAGLNVRLSDDLLVWCTIGVVLGGRLGYVLFYQPNYFFTHPSQILLIWQGGMSFHGGLLGTMVALLLFARRRRRSPLAIADALGCAAPLGLFFGRIANFVNGELYGRASSLPWAMVFPNGGPEPRHPSQLYQALLEGVVLFALVNGVLFTTAAASRPGRLAGLFLIGYAACRAIGELFREPDAFLGFIAGGLTMGQFLSLPMLLLGLFLFVRARPSVSLAGFDPRLKR
jgi:phosphatidylglycerol:prolipoprotein diacylglycerol transferase